MQCIFCGIRILRKIFSYYLIVNMIINNKSAINDIANNKLDIHKHEYVNQIRNRIDQYEKRLAKEIGRTVSVGLGWNPSHLGILGN